MSFNKVYKRKDTETMKNSDDHAMPKESEQAALGVPDTPAKLTPARPLQVYFKRKLKQSLKHGFTGLDSRCSRDIIHNDFMFNVSGSGSKDVGFSNIGCDEPVSGREQEPDNHKSESTCFVAKQFADSGKEAFHGAGPFKEREDTDGGAKYFDFSSSVELNKSPDYTVSISQEFAYQGTQAAVDKVAASCFQVAESDIERNGGMLGSGSYSFAYLDLLLSSNLQCDKNKSEFLIPDYDQPKGLEYAVSLMENETDKLHDEFSQPTKGSTLSPISTPPQKHTVDRRPKNGTYLNRRQHLRAIKKKHRPKVINEGKPKRTPKLATPEPASSKQAVSVKRKYVRESALKKSVNEDIVSEVSVRRSLNFDLENQSRYESTDAAIDHNVEKSVQKGDIGSVLSPHHCEHCSKTANASGIGSTDCRWSNGAELDKIIQAHTSAKEHRENPCILNQTGLQYNSLRAYESSFLVNDCLSMTRELGLNFPEMYKKKSISRRQKEYKSSFWGFTTAAKHGKQWVKGYSGYNVITSRVKSKLVRKKKSLMKPENMVLADKTSSSECLLSLRQGMVQIKGKRSKRSTHVRSSDSLHAIPMCNQQLTITSRQQGFANVLGAGISNRALCSNNNERRLTDRCTMMEQSLVNSEFQDSNNERSSILSIQTCNFDSLYALPACNQSLASVKQELLGEKQGNEIIQCPKAWSTAFLTENYDVRVLDACTKMRPFVVCPGIRTCRGKENGCSSDSSNSGIEWTTMENAGQPRGPHDPLYGSQQLECESMDIVIHENKSLEERDGGNRLIEPNHNADGPDNKHNALVPYQEALGPTKKRTPPKVDLDSETLTMWNLLMNIDDGGSEEIADREKEKWWEGERKVFRGRIDSFIARMHLIQGILTTTHLFPKDT